jgi:SNF2 family DNA or RNA helicase
MGLTFGQKFTLFRSVFYDVKLTYFKVDYKFNRSHMSDLRRMMRNRSIVYEDVEFADLPPVVYQTIKVHMTDEMRPYYEQRVAKLREAWKSRDVRLIENTYIQTRSITSGFVVGDVQMENEKVRVRFQFNENPKLDVLKGLLTSLPFGRKITVYHEYIFSGDIIYKLARQLKLNPARLGGGAKGIENVKKFLEDDTCRVLVSQSKAGGVGNNFQGVCNYCVYYETPSSPIVRKQSEKRFPREGQLHKVFIYDLVMDGTIDNDVLSDLQSGIDFANKLLRPKQGELPLGG